jgi:predicted heme/steroid binding protein
MSESAQSTKKFEPKKAVELAPPKDDPITPEYLAKCDGTNEGYPTYVAIMGTAFDVTGNDSYAAGKPYHVFTGKEPNRALAKSSLKPEDCVADYEDLPDNEKQVLNDWFTFFSKRYNVVGKVKSEGSSNL